MTFYGSNNTGSDWSGGSLPNRMIWVRYNYMVTPSQRDDDDGEASQFVNHSRLFFVFKVM